MDKFGFRKSKVCCSLCGVLLGIVVVVSLVIVSIEIYVDEVIILFIIVMKVF